MTRSSLRLGLALLTLVLATLSRPAVARAQQLGEGMDRSGTVGIQNEAERKLFSSLICTCGCPREALDSCTCGFAHARRDDLRAELASGKPIEQIQEEYAAQHGLHALAVPPNTGIHRWVWMFPVGAIVLGAAGVVVTLRRWRRRSVEREAAERKAANKAAHKAKKHKKGGAPVTTPEAAHDRFDDQLDEELARLDE